MPTAEVNTERVMRAPVPNSYLLYKDQVRGLVYEVESGRLREVCVQQAKTIKFQSL